MRKAWTVLALLTACTSVPKAPGSVVDDAGQPETAPSAPDARVRKVDGGAQGTDAIDASVGIDALGDAADDMSDLPDLEQPLRAIVEPHVDATGATAERAVGIAVAVLSARRAEVFGFGARRVGGETPDGDTFFQIGSVSKIFTGLLLAIVVESTAFAISPTDPVDAHLQSDLQLGRAVTLQQLVSHYASFPQMPDNRTGPPYSPAYDYSRADLADFLGRYVPKDPPGTRYRYSNVGIGLLALALADATEVAGFDPLLRKWITEPLQMHDTGTNEPAFVDPMGQRLAQGYAVGRGSTLREVALSDMGVLAGAGEVISTARDMLRLLAALTGHDDPLVGGATARIERPLGPTRKGQIGYAVDILQDSNGSSFNAKSGTTAGYTAHIAWRRDPPAGVVVLCNGHPPAHEIGNAALEMLTETDR
jgi:D-alanyl-D-alanine-carboxypeptidase/D-alanyl-D-alanine-endopeptidase